MINAEGWDGGLWCCNFRDFVVSQTVVDNFQLEEVHSLLSNVDIVQDMKDEFAWMRETNEDFSVKSCFVALNSRLTFNRLPTRDQLVRRGIVIDDREKSCVFCFREEQSKAHLFGLCVVTRRIWSNGGIWLGRNLELSNEELASFILNCHKVKKKKIRTLLGWFGWLSLGIFG
ncbi:unnamed protein product [Vicia faba]|uniref:Reverse transcriptase zinc-binding domain-containing protein n=1 Tax=Vicia faba TaxID=3906 RepID=A0AAV0ZRC1_VICFA|nr:unnamed protein product [Vicia faba]